MSYTKDYTMCYACVYVILVYLLLIYLSPFLQQQQKIILIIDQALINVNY